MLLLSCWCGGAVGIPGASASSEITPRFLFMGGSVGREEETHLLGRGGGRYRCTAARRDNMTGGSSV